MFFNFLKKVIFDGFYTENGLYTEKVLVYIGILIYGNVLSLDGKSEISKKIGPDNSYYKYIPGGVFWGIFGGVPGGPKKGDFWVFWDTSKKIGPDNSYYKYIRKVKKRLFLGGPEGSPKKGKKGEKCTIFTFGRFLTGHA